MKFGPAKEIELSGRRWIAIPVRDPRSVNQCVEMWKASCDKLENALAELVLDKHTRNQSVAAIVSEVPEGAILMHLCVCHGWNVMVLVKTGERGEQP